MGSACTNCAPCNSCQGDCVSCQICVSGCEVSCDQAQTFCSLGKETIAQACEQGAFAFSYCPVKDTGIIGPGYFDQHVWDELASWISRRASLPVTPPAGKLLGGGGTTNGYGGSEVNLSNIEDVAPFKAAEFNRISVEVNGPTVAPNDLMTAELFLNLESAANSKTISGDACSMCNASCDNSCDVCEKCDQCQGCESCEGCVYCQLCEGCAGDCEMCDNNCQDSCENTT